MAGGAALTIATLGAAGPLMAAVVIRGLSNANKINDASSSRGLNELGGIVSWSGENAKDGQIYTSTGTIAQRDFAGIVDTALMKGEEVHILTGAHGLPDGSWKADPSMYAEDITAFGKFKDVSVHDFPSMTADDVYDVLERPGVIIGGLCESDACLAPYRWAKDWS
jgi:hypothetical protein